MVSLMTLRCWAAALAAALFLIPATVVAQNRLPVDEGIYAEVGQPCTSGWLWVYFDQRAGNLSFYGPNRSMGPRLASVERIVSVGPGHDGFTAINDLGEEVRAAGNGQIILRAYSLAHGEEGRRSLRRCAVSALHPRMQAAVRQLGYSENSATRARESGQSALSANGTWRVSNGSNGMAFAQVIGAGGLPQATAQCRGGVAYLHLRTSAAERGRGPRRIEFVGRTTGQSRAETFQRDAETGDWSGRVGRETIGLLSGRDTEVEMREDGRLIGRLSLVGSTAALGQALAGCPISDGLAAVPPPEDRRNETPRQTGSVRTAPVASGPIPIRTGYWAASCAEPDGGILYDGRRIGQIGWGAVQFWEPVGRVERSGRSYFLDAHGMMIEPLGADRLKLTIQDDTVLNYCPNDRLPASLRTIITRLTGR